MTTPDDSLRSAVANAFEGRTVSPEMRREIDRVVDWGFQGQPPPLEAGGETARSLYAKIVVAYVAQVLDDHHISPEEQQRIRLLRYVLGLEEEELLRHAAAEIEWLLDAELNAILQDDTVDWAEALHQVELQRAFGLSYDDYQRLIGRSLGPVVARLVAERDAVDSSPERRDAAALRLRRLDVLRAP